MGTRPEPVAAAPIDAYWARTPHSAVEPLTSQHQAPVRITQRWCAQQHGLILSDPL